MTFDGKVLPDPYCMGEDRYVDKDSKWPSVAFGDLYVYLVDTKGLSPRTNSRRINHWRLTTSSTTDTYAQFSVTSVSLGHLFF